MAKQDKKNLTKKGPKNIRETFLSLFKPKSSFARNRREARMYLEYKKEDAAVMAEAIRQVLLPHPGNSVGTIGSYEGSTSEEIYLYDFISEAYNHGGFSGISVNFNEQALINSISTGSGPIGTTPTPTTVAISNELEKTPPKIKLKPIDVWKELETIPNPASLENLEEKIMVLNMKKEFIRSNHYAKKEVIDMITRLENRRKYLEFEDFFKQFDNTDTDKVNALINKYDLVLKTSDLFIPKFPKDAMEIMKAYKENVKKLCGKSSVFYVIAEKAMFAAEEKRNDPILLVQSPFGIYWQILGAWDKELVLLEEL